MKKTLILLIIFLSLIILTSCENFNIINNNNEVINQNEDPDITDPNQNNNIDPNPNPNNNNIDNTNNNTTDITTIPLYNGLSDVITKYVDENDDIAYIPAGFIISSDKDEKIINTGLVIIGIDGSEYVWVPTTSTSFTRSDFGSYYSSYDSFKNYYDETDLLLYKEMEESVAKYNGFYMGRFEASYSSGTSLDDYIPASKRILSSDDGRIWVNFGPSNATRACENLYKDNDTVQAFFPWGINYDTTLSWLISTGNKTYNQVASDSTTWGNYSNDTFSENETGKTTGKYEQTKSNNIYDLAGNNWEWTRERNGSNYVMRGGGYNLMGGPCLGSKYPAALRDPLPGNNNHPNVTFRIALYVR